MKKLLIAFALALPCFARAQTSPYTAICSRNFTVDVVTASSAPMTQVFSGSGNHPGRTGKSQLIVMQLDNATPTQVIYASSWTSGIATSVSTTTYGWEIWGSSATASAAGAAPQTFNWGPNVPIYIWSGANNPPLTARFLTCE